VLQAAAFQANTIIQAMVGISYDFAHAAPAAIPVMVLIPENPTAFTAAADPPMCEIPLDFAATTDASIPIMILFAPCPATLTNTAIPFMSNETAPFHTSISSAPDIMPATQMFDLQQDASLYLIPEKSGWEEPSRPFHGGWGFASLPSNYHIQYFWGDVSKK
jgi:hypothetical protein